MAIRLFLQQPATLRPLVGQPIVFGQVARRASNYNVFGAIRSTTSQRDHMVDMVSLTDFAFAIVAAPLLGLVLALDIGCGVLTLRIALEGTTIMGCGKRFIPIVFVILSFPHQQFFSIAFAILSISLAFHSLARIPILFLGFGQSFFVGFSILTVTLCRLFFVGVTVSLVDLIYFFLVCLVVFSIVLGDQGLIGHTIGKRTCLAMPVQTILGSCAFRKVLTCCWLFFATLTTLLGWGGIWGKITHVISSYKLVAGPGAFIAPPGVSFTPVSIPHMGGKVTPC